MPDPRATNLAKILVNYSTKVQPGEWVFIRFNVVALPLAREVYREVLRAGGHPTMVHEDDDLREIFVSEANESQLKWISPSVELLYNQADVMIYLDAARNTRHLMGTDPQRWSRRLQALRGLRETYIRRTAAGEMRWVLTQFPCHALAQEADMSLRAFEDFVYAATYADQPDPIQRWQSIHDEQQRLVDWLKGKREVVIRSPNADLRLSIAGRGFINADGSRNMPSGEIFTSPVEDSVNGWIRFTFPAVKDGRVVEGVELEFTDGKVTGAKARTNEGYLLAMLDSDEGARYLGEFAVGTNYAVQRFTKSILYDEKIGGSIHLAVGTGFPEVGGVNQSSIHWDFICDMRAESEILVDGELFYKNGQFKI